jgi:hypothetical protein
MVQVAGKLLLLVLTTFNVPVRVIPLTLSKLLLTMLHLPAAGALQDPAILTVCAVPPEN